jgi:hypothetical protein
MPDVGRNPKNLVIRTVMQRCQNPSASTALEQHKGGMKVRRHSYIKLITLTLCTFETDWIWTQRTDKCDRLHRQIEKKKLHGLSPRANYTDRATAACRRSDCQLLRIEGATCVCVTDHYGRILGFLERSRYFSIKYLLSCTHEAEWTPFQTHYFFLYSAGNRTRSSWSVAKNSDH